MHPLPVYVLLFKDLHSSLLPFSHSHSPPSVTLFHLLKIRYKVCLEKTENCIQFFEKTFEVPTHKETNV